MNPPPAPPRRDGREPPPRIGGRRGVLRGLLGGPGALWLPQGRSADAGQAGPAPAPSIIAGWHGFRDRFLLPEGRVIDTGNDGVSHSEGQGWALLFATYANDRDAFDRILDWTRRTLARSGDTLLAWRYRPGAAVPVDDPNNATDGDLCIAWALLRAARAWREPAYRDAAASIASDMLGVLHREAGPYGVLLPGAVGFEEPEAITINPSYLVFPAFRALAAAFPGQGWERITADGLKLLNEVASFGAWGLPPDWLTLTRADAAASLPPAWPARFSYDAVRVPLWLAWARLRGEPAFARARAFWSDPGHPHIPAWMDLVANTPAPYPAGPGILSVVELTIEQHQITGRDLRNQPTADSISYYDSALEMLSTVAFTAQNGDDW